MNTQAKIVDGHVHGGCLNRFSWSAIVVGALVGVGLSFLINLLAIGIGATALTTTADGASKVAIGGFVWLVVGSIIAMFACGWIAGYLARHRYCHKHHYGELYGFTAWCLALLISIFFAGQIGQMMTNYNYFVNPSSTDIVYTHRTDAPVVDARSESRTSAAASTVTVQPEKAVTSAAFITFFLFFIGALSSSFGGFFGMSFRKRSTDCTTCSICH